jgi:high-affinity nickel-transport protein
MITLFSILLLGFFLGMRHATDADHVVAVTNIVSQQRSIRSAAWTGVFWGIGHSITLLVVGGAIIVFGLVVSERLGLGLELSVAAMLIVLGLMNLNAAFGWFGDAREAERRHAEEGARYDRWLRSLGAGRALRPLLIGVVHGLAGSAAVALRVLPLIRNTAGAIAYLLVFGGGTIAGMMLITATIALPVRYAAARSAVLSRLVGGLAGALSFCFGAFLVYHIGFVDKLFLSGS